MRIVGLWRFPVKSAQGERVAEVAVDPSGFRGDRRWALADKATGRILTGRRVPGLLFGSASTTAEGRPRLTLPDGSRPATDAELSAWVGFPVQMVAATAGTWQYEILTDDTDEAASDWQDWEGGPGSFHNSSRSSITIIDRATADRWDVRRFRMNVIVETDQLDALLGRRVRLGTAEASVVKRTGRCVMVTRPQPGLDEDRAILREIVRDHGGQLGLGATVTGAGHVRVGDVIEILD